jgi:hypothetical protein
MSFDVISLAEAMTVAASKSVICWPAIRLVAESELRRFAETLEEVRSLYAEGIIEEDEAMDIAGAHRVAAQTALRSVQSVGVMTARAAAPRVMKAAVGEARLTVNRTVGFPLI